MGSSKKWVIVAVVVLVVGIGGFFVYQNNQNSKSADDAKSQSASQPSDTSSKNIVVIATDTSTLSTLVAAVKAAALVDTLQGTGPYTVLAPTNVAFEKLPAGTVDTLLKPENKEQLKNILTYHVIAGSVMAKDLTNGQKVKTVNGQELTVEITDGKVYFIDAKGGKAMVEKADINASNGTVHIINAVLLPQ